jgi:hypothetical protein
LRATSRRPTSARMMLVNIPTPMATVVIAGSLRRP